MSQKGLKSQKWSEQEIQLMLNLHNQHGNRWCVIAEKMNNRNDNSIKNKFYSTLRKGLRKLNDYIVNIKRKVSEGQTKNYKTIKSQFINKLNAVTDRNHQNKLEVKQLALTLSQSIERKILEIAVKQIQYVKPQNTDYQNQENILKQIGLFNKNCKKRKGKRKIVKNSLEQSSQNQISANSLIEEGIVNHGTEQIKQLEEKQKQKKQNILRPLLSQSTNLVKSEFSQNQNHFSFMAMDFIKLHENLIQQDRLERSELFKSTSTSRERKKHLSTCLIQPSPVPNDNTSPFSLTNIMKNNNITINNMFDSKSLYDFQIINGEDEKEDKNKSEGEAKLNFVESIPIIQDGNCLNDFFAKSMQFIKEKETNSTSRSTYLFNSGIISHSIFQSADLTSSNPELSKGKSFLTVDQVSCDYNCLQKKKFVPLKNKKQQILQIQFHLSQNED